MLLQKFRFYIPFAWLVAGIAGPAFSQTTGGAPASQVNVLNQKKFNVYKAEIKGDVVKEGIKGVSVFFSCEYTFADDEYKQMASKSGQNYFTFWVSLYDKNGELVYDGYQYSTYKRNQPVANHFATTIAYGSKVKTAKPEPWKSTGIELFIPYAHLNLPEGSSEVKVLFNAYAGNSDAPGKRFDHFHAQPVALNKPAYYWVKFTPKQLALADKSGKKTEVSQIAEDFGVGRGNDKNFTDLIAIGKGVVGTPAGFPYSEGDAMQIRTQREKGTTGELAYRQRPVKTTNGQPVAGPEANIQAAWPLDLKADKTIALKNPSLDVTFSVEKIRMPAVRFSAFKVNRYTKFEGATGASLSFDYEATVAPGLPNLMAVPFYSTSDEEKGGFTPLKGLKVMTGNAKVDTTGAIDLGHSASGKIEVFFPYASFLVYDESTRKTGPKRFRLDVQLEGSTENLTRKMAKQSLEVNTLKDASVALPTVGTEVVFNNARGISIAIPYQVPAMYADLLHGKFAIQITEVNEKTEEPRLMSFLKKTTLMNDLAKKVATPGDRSGSSVTYLVDKPSGNIQLFMPYATLALTENASPMRFTGKISMTSGSAANALELGTTASGIKLNLDEKKLRFLTVGVSGIRMKEAGESIAWRIRSADGLIYQSPLIPAEKKMDNFYAHNYCASEEDKVTIEVLKGNDLNSLKEIGKWEIPVKSMKPVETVEIVKEGASPDPSVRNVAVTYKIN